MPLICEPTGEEPCYSKISTSDFGAEQRHKAWNNEKRPRWVKITMAMKYHVKLPTVTWLSPQCAKQRVLKLRLLSLILRETSLPRSRFFVVTPRGARCGPSQKRPRARLPGDGQNFKEDFARLPASAAHKGLFTIYMGKPVGLWFG